MIYKILAPISAIQSHEISLTRMIITVFSKKDLLHLNWNNFDIIYVLIEKGIKGNQMNTKSILALILTLSFLTACAQPTSTSAYPPPASIPATPTGNVTYPAPTEVLPITTQITVDLAPQVMAAEQALSEKYNIPIDQIKIVSAEAVTWPTGCLGVVIPGVMCTDMVVNGFRIIMQANGQQYEFHTNQDGTNVVDAAQQLATLGFVVSTSANAIQVVNPNIALGPTYDPAFNGFLPLGGSILGTAYVYDPNQMKVVEVSATGQQTLTFIQNPTYGLAIWRGGQGAEPLLAWGTQLYPNNSSSLMVANPDGSNLETLLTINAAADAPVQLVAEFWSADGQSLYFSKEPVGIGGYILFGGASNLYKIDIATKEVTDVIPQNPSTGPQACLDAISGDYRFVADHCTQGVITVRNLQAGSTTTLKVPTDFTGYNVMGSARFSPTGDRVAFALAKSDPNAEQGWVAIGNSTGGTAQLIATSDTGSYYTVQGWLDDQTVLVQSNSITSPNGVNQVITVSADGSVITKVAEGSLLTVIDNR